MIPVHDIMVGHVRSQPGHDAIVTVDSTLTYEGLHGRILAVAEWLVTNGLRPGVLAGVSVRDEVDHVITTMALLYLGTPNICLSSHVGPAARDELARRLGATQHVVDATLPEAAGCQRLQPPFRTIGDAARGREIDKIIASMGGRSDAPLIYRTTSGTTGAPKAFAVEMQLIRGAVERISGLSGEQRVLRGSSVEFDSSRMGRITSLLAGHTCIFLNQMTGATLPAFCARARVTEIQLGTFKLASILSGVGPAAPLPPFTRITTGGSRVSGQLRAETRARLTRELWISYATSEFGVISLATPDEHEAFPDGVGYPLPKVGVAVLGKEGAPVNPGEPGELWVKKAGTSGFADRDYASALGDGWLPTRDILSWPTDSPLLYHGRADDVIILNGFNIFPSAIEDVLEAHPDVLEAIGYGVPSRVHGQIPVAAVVLRPGAADRGTDHLVSFARERLALHAPRRIIVVARIPRTALGKPSRSALLHGL